MFTKKFFILGVAMLLALVCAGTLSAFAASTTPAKKNTAKRYWNAGIAAIPTLHKKPHSLLTRQEVVTYLNKQRSTSSKLVNGQVLGIQVVELTDPLNLNSLKHILVPGVPAHEQVYYAKLNGPFTVDPKQPLPLLSMLLPNSNTLPLLISGVRNLPLIQSLGALGAELGDLGNTDLPFVGSLNDMPVLNHLGTLVSVGNMGLKRIILSLFGIYDAHTGNLLAWGGDRP